MSDQKSPQVGHAGWIDLTVPDAERVRDFYGAVMGWTSENVDMGGYADFNMRPPGGPGPVAGICHARGENASQPPAWIVYFVVVSLDESLKQCLALGGRQIGAVRGVAGAGRYVVIADPAGAVCALFERADAAARS